MVNVSHHSLQYVSLVRQPGRVDQFGLAGDSMPMEYVQAIFDNFYVKVPGDVQGMIKDFVNRAAKNWVDHAAGRDLLKHKIYRNVKVMISHNYGDVWRIRMGGGNLTY
jgi:hypothetical protein